MRPSRTQTTPRGSTPQSTGPQHQGPQPQRMGRPRSLSHEAIPGAVTRAPFSSMPPGVRQLLIPYKARRLLTVSCTPSLPMVISVSVSRVLV